MYLHVGNQVNIRERDIIGIFDMDRTTTSKVTRKFLIDAQKRGVVTSVKDEVPKSFILYRERPSGDICVCFSPISASALCGRMEATRTDAF